LISPILQIVIALVMAQMAMAVVWLVAMRIRNAGIVDVAWAASFSLLAFFFAATGPGAIHRRLLIGGMMLLWSARLAFHLYRRVRRLHPAEDSRYEQLRKEWAPDADRRFFVFFQAQGLSNVLLSAPIFVACLNRTPGIAALEWIGTALWVIAVSGETIADRQLERFKKDPANRGRTCRVGLWRYSRHPNYFFEWLVWVAYFAFALPSPGGWLTVFCPLVILYLLLRVTGIPRTEIEALKSRGDEYREYQRTTSAFFPLPPRDATK
jgi:steroid 5-alpha reductase family enzyme